MIGGKEQQPETELSSTSNFQLLILKLVATFLGMALLISHALVDPNLVRH